MILCVSGAKPKLCIDPVVLGVARGPYWVAITGLLVQLNGNGHKISIVSDEEKAHAGCDVAYISFLVQSGNSLQDVVVHHVNMAGLEAIAINCMREAVHYLRSILKVHLMLYCDFDCLNAFLPAYPTLSVCLSVCLYLTLREEPPYLLFSSFLRGEE